MHPAARLIIPIGPGIFWQRVKQFGFGLRCVSPQEAALLSRSCEPPQPAWKTFTASSMECEAWTFVIFDEVTDRLEKFNTVINLNKKLLNKILHNMGPFYTKGLQSLYSRSIDTLISRPFLVICQEVCSCCHSSSIFCFHPPIRARATSLPSLPPSKL